MSRKVAVVIIVVVVLGLIYQSIKFQYNRLVSLDQKVREAWAQVDNVLQRRNDLIPNLVATVKGYAKHEKEVFLEVTRARSAVMDARTVSEKAAASSQLEATLRKLLLVVENYPQLKANENFLHLQDELAGTENRISVERKRYNEAVNAYNRTARSFPVNLFVNVFGFEREKPYFQATAGSQTPPRVEFE